MTADTVLAEALDRHWMDWNEEARTAVCSCGGWQFDAERDIVVGEHFAPFSKHVAAALAERGIRLVSEDSLDEATHRTVVVDPAPTLPATDTEGEGA